MKNEKAKAAPAIVREKGGWPCELAGSIGGSSIIPLSVPRSAEPRCLQSAWGRYSHDKGGV